MKIRKKIKILLMIFMFVTLATNLNLALAVTPDDDYKKTSELTDEDVADNYQKNYQEITHSDGSYLTKSAEWIDKENGEALITIKASQVAKEKTTALYVATMCYAHGLTEQVIIDNLVTLTQSYDNVDFIAINKAYEAGITETKRFTSKSTEEEIKAYVQATKAAGEEYPHWLCSMPAAIQKYLFGNKGDSYISEDNMINKPIAIYVSCDSIYLRETVATECWGMEYSTPKYHNFMRDVYKGRYFSMSQTSQQMDSPTIIIRYANACVFNKNMMDLVIGILNPENYGKAESVLSAESLNQWHTSTIESIELPYTDKKYAAQYSYDKNFKEAGVKIISNCTIVDTMVDEYEILKAQAETNMGNILPVDIDGQKITLVDSNYASGEEIVLKIYVKLKPDVIANFGNFTNTNVGGASISSDFNDVVLSVESPKLIPITSNYTVNYIDRYTNQPIKSAKIEKDVAIGTDVKSLNEAISINGYTYMYSDVNNVIVNKDEKLNVINLYYAKNTTLTVNYIDRATNIVLDSYTENGYQGKDYTTSSKDFERYILVEIPTNQNGKLEYNGTTVNYYYLYTSELKIKYIDANTGNEIALPISTTLKEGDEYTTTPKEIEDYKLALTPDNANGTMRREDIEVVYQYKKISAGVDVKYIDQVTKEEVATSEHFDGLENDDYTTSEKMVDGYTLVLVPDNATGKMTVGKITVTYEYRKNSNVIVEYIDENYNTNIIANVVTRYKEGDSYTTEEKSFEGYQLTGKTNNTTGTVVREDITVTYRYKKISAGVDTKFIDQVTGQEIATVEHQDGLELDDYTTEAKVIDGYELVKVPTNASGKMTVAKTIVTYEYRKNSNVIVEYIDENYNTNIIPNVVTKYKEGDVYTTEEKVFPGYQLTGKTTNTSGTVGNADITVTYKYKKISAGVEIRYIDQVTGDIIADTIVKTGLEKAPYTSAAKTVEGYELVLTPTNANGEMAVEKTVVTYEYRKNSYVTVKYIDENNGQTLFGPVNTKYKEGDIYTTVQEDISGYTFTRVDGEKTAAVERENIVVTYYYKKNTSVTVRYVDMLDKNKEIVESVVIPGLENDDYETEQKDIEGYIFVETSGLVNGKMKSEPTEVIYKYKKASKLITEHIDENSGEKIVADVETIYKEGDTYEALAQSIPGYVLVREPDEKTGVMGRENVTKTFYYKKLAGGLVVKYVDKVTGELLDQEIYTGNEADKIILEEKTFLKYVLHSKPDFNEIELTEELQEVTYYYIKMAKIPVIGIDQDTQEVLYETEVSGLEGDTYTTIARIVAGYELVRIPDNANGTFTREDTKVIYEYRKIAGKVTVKYIDKETNTELDNCTITGKVGDNYQTERKTFEDYEFVEVVGEEVGILAKEEKEVVYYYVKKTGKLAVRYIDTEGNELLREESEAKVGELYKVEEKEIKGYEVIQRPENLEGKYEEGITEVIFVVKKIVNGKVVVKYVDKETGKELDKYIINGREGDSYQTEKKEFENYKLVEVKGEESGVIAKEEKEVVYYYESTIIKGTIIVKFVDEDGNSLLEDYVEENEVGKPFYMELPDIEGYEKVENKPIQATFVNGEIVLVAEYRKIEELPETGDINVVLLIAISILSLVILGKKAIKE